MRILHNAIAICFAVFATTQGAAGEVTLQRPNSYNDVNTQLVLRLQPRVRLGCLESNVFVFNERGTVELPDAFLSDSGVHINVFNAEGEFIASFAPQASESKRERLHVRDRCGTGIKFCTPICHNRNAAATVIDDSPKCVLPGKYILQATCKLEVVLRKPQRLVSAPVTVNIPGTPTDRIGEEDSDGFDVYLERRRVPLDETVVLLACLSNTADQPKAIYNPFGDVLLTSTGMKLSVLNDRKEFIRDLVLPRSRVVRSHKSEQASDWIALPRNGVLVREHSIDASRMSSEVGKFYIRTVCTNILFSSLPTGGPGDLNLTSWRAKYKNGEVAISRIAELDLVDHE